MHRRDAASRRPGSSERGPGAQAAPRAPCGRSPTRAPALGSRRSPPAALTTACPRLPPLRWPSRTRGDLFKQQRALGPPQAWILPPPLPSSKMLESLNFFFFFSVQLSFFGAHLSRFSSAICQHLRTPRGVGNGCGGEAATWFPAPWACSHLLPAGKGYLPPLWQFVPPHALRLLVFFGRASTWG